MAGNNKQLQSAEIWDGLYARLIREVDPVVFNPWLKPLQFVDLHGGVVRLSHSSAFRRNWVMNTYEEYLLDMWRGENSAITAVKIIVKRAQDGEPRTRPDERVPVVRYAVEPTVATLPDKQLGPVRAQLGRVGVWSRSPYFFGPDQATRLAATAEELGYGALWIPGFDGGHIFERCAMALEATSTLTVATGIVNIWRHDPVEVAQMVAKLRADSNGRFLLGIGGSHKYLIGEAYDKITPMTKMRNYLDALDAAGLAESDRLLGALGPKMLALSAERSAGAHPCFIPPEFTAAARDVLGDGPLLMPEVTVILERDASVARAYARKFANLFFSGPNYANMLRRFGFNERDFAGEGSDRLIDAVVAWGDPATIARRVQAHLDAGADHVAIQYRGTQDEADVWRELAPYVLG